MPQAKRKQIKETEQGLLSPRVKELSSEIGVVVSAFLSIYALLSLLTYSPLDPGWSHSGGSGREVSNLGGQFGANFSDMLLHGFGYISFLVPIMILAIGINYFRHRHSTEEPSYLKRVLVATGFLITVMGGCGLENLHFNHWAADEHFNAGGYLGGWLTSGLVEMFGQIGSTLLMVTLFLIGVTIFSGLSWFRLMDNIGAGIFNMVERFRDQREEKQDREIGAKARIVRQETVTELKEKVKVAPTIMPKIAPSAAISDDSGRMEREKQANLFDAMHSSNDALPALSLLDAPEPQVFGYSDEELNALSVLLVKKLADFNVPVEVVSVHQGPVITRFEIDPAPGIKAATIVGLARDLARAMSTMSVRVVENIPGKSYLGIEIPNESREIVRLVEGLSSSQFEDMNSPLALVLGKDISGKTVIADLAKMPHVLIAGTTGSGKSVCINALILSLIYKATAQQVRMIMIDPKMLELSVYEGIPHLLCPVVTDMSEAANALRWSIVEMERRYKLMSELGVRNLAGYNRKVKLAEESGAPILDPMVREGQVAEPLQELPCLVVIIDELADLMMSVGKKVEELITRLAQKGRASGVHLILATQRPSVDVITGLLKANIPTRIAFQVSSKVDSRTIIDQMGAEMLLGHGDMLYLPPGTSLPDRVHGSFVSDKEVHCVVTSLKGKSEPEYDESILSAPKEVNDALPSAFRDDAVNDDPENDPLYDQAVEFVTRTRKASISSVQRQLRVGYNRAARMIETMEMTGVITAAEDNGRREVLAPPPVED
ncbi:DNA translocase FtsK [Arenicella xantha]|uniref:DNA translocase FtsK n=1 Tax=Arenicella xantha TaxID=644221 RepID=A0A395JMM5_9GAMM|nr:DNA translocase FtsK [Arenicella xantha]RBP49154.1 S-DNA-T family DNA segregation ATPase FtsK/SpoIIIE [Arenicella xantha]